MAAGTLIAAGAGAGLAADGIAQRSVLPVAQQFYAPSSDSGDKPRGISALACAAPKPDGARECLAVNDEESFGEIAILTSSAFRPTGHTVAFVRDGDEGADVSGSIRDPHCPKESRKQERFGEVDGEAAAIGAGYLYVASSHSCSGKGYYKPSSYLLSRFRMADATTIARGTDVRVERTWRLADALLASDAGPAFGKPKDDGTNVEGIALVDGTLYAGLRMPTRDGRAFIVTAPVEALFAAGAAPLDPAVVKTHSVALGADIGIRDMAALAGGDLLILSGPTWVQPDIPYALWIADRKRLDAPPRFLATVPDPRTFGENPKARGYGGDTPKAEAVAVLTQTSDTLTVLVMYDNVDEGWPTRLEVKLPRG